MNKTNLLCLIPMLLLSGCATQKFPARAPSQPVRKASPPPQALAATTGFTVSPADATAGTSGGSGTISLTASWTASSSDPTWLTITPTSGSGNTTLTWSAAPNTGPARTATLTIAGQTFVVTQAGAVVTDIALTSGVPLNDSLNATASQSTWKYYYIDVPVGASSLVVDALNMTGDVDLYVKFNAKPTLSLWDCRPYIGGTVEKCTFNSPAAGRWWIGIVNYATGTISYTVKATTVVSLPCIYALSPKSSSIGPAGGIGMVSVTTDAGCTWSSSSTVAWITTSSTGTGSGQASYTVASNTSTNSRFGILAIAGQAFTVTQAGTAPVVTSTNGWARRFGGTGYEYGNAVAVDSNGNIIMAGFGNSASVDFGTGPLASGIFLAKFTALGTNLWSKRIPADAQARPICVTTDANGNIYVGGHFYDTIDFGTGLIASVTPGKSDIFVARYSAAGDYQWAKTFGSHGVQLTSGMDQIYGIAVDSSSVVISGTLSTADTINFGGADKTGGTYLVKLSAANGSHIWSKTFGSKSYSQGNGVAIAANGDIVLVGQFDGGMDLTMDNNVLTFAYTTNTLFADGSAGVPSKDMFLARYDSAGTPVWWERFGGAYWDSAIKVALDSSGNLFVTGEFMTRIDLGGGHVLTTSEPYTDVYLAKFSPGSAGVPAACLWAKSFSGQDNEKPTGLAVDGNGDVLVTGNFTYTLNVSGTVLTASQVFGSFQPDSFVAKYNNGGVLSWAKRFGGTNTDYVSHLAVGADGNPVAIGEFIGNTQYGDQAFTSAGSYDMVLWKIIP